jgi:hypothetical protein
LDTGSDTFGVFVRLYVIVLEAFCFLTAFKSEVRCASLAVNDLLVDDPERGLTVTQFKLLAHEKVGGICMEGLQRRFGVRRLFSDQCTLRLA